MTWILKGRAPAERVPCSLCGTLGLHYCTGRRAPDKQEIIDMMRQQDSKLFEQLIHKPGPIPQQILQYIGTEGEVAVTAARVARVLKLKLSSVSSALHKLFKAGKLERIKGFGKSGGYGYFVPYKARVK